MSRNKSKHLAVQPKKELSKIDVVIPVYGQYGVLDQGLNALIPAMSGIPYKVYITDDCSPTLETEGKHFYNEAKSKYPQIVSIGYHKSNQGFAKSCNDAGNLGNSKYILIHSTDVILTQDAVKIMYDHIENNPDIAIIAPKLLFFPDQNDPNRPAGRVQSVGLFFDANGEPYHPFSGWDEKHPLVNVVRDLNAATGATFLMRRNVWQQLRGFALDYGRGTYEDVDISFRTRLLGHKIRILPQAVGYHYTNLSVLGDKQGFPLNHNHDIFRAKYQQIIPYDAWIQSGIFYDD